MKQCSICKQTFDAGNIFCPTDGEKLVDTEDTVKDDPLIGEMIDNKYLVQSKAARGGTATVYRARHVQLDLDIALKVMHSHLTIDKTAIERFRREAVAAMQIRHPNAIAVLDFAIRPDSMVYVVTEFLSGVSLQDKISSEYRFSITEANDIMQQACAAIAVAHKRGIVHRDLKPDNIFLHNDQGQEVVKVVDFGIAKLGDSLNESSGRLTRQGYVLGTPHYMSPEQCQDKDVDARTDIYSMGVVLYEMLAGVVPFNGRTYSAIVLQKTREKPKPVSEIRSDIPPIIDAVILRAMAKKPEDRPDTITAFARELEIAVRAITESEFMSIFQNASEHELEAAILLAGEPARNLTGHLKANPNLLSFIKSKDSENPLNIDIDEGLRGIVKDNAASLRELPSLESVVGTTLEAPNTIGGLLHNPSNTTDLTAFKDTANLKEILNRDSDSSYDELLQFTDDAPVLLHQEMLQLSKETQMLLQIVVDDLGIKASFDSIFFSELRNTIDSLRAVMFHIQRFYEQNQPH